MELIFYATHLLAHDSLEMSSLSFTKNQKTSLLSSFAFMIDAVRVIKYFLKD